MNILVKFIEDLQPLQYELNDYIKPDWRETLNDDDFSLAILDESSELLNSFHWKWWKDTDKERMSVLDYDNVRTELIDILHFLLSRTYYNPDWKERLTDKYFKINYSSIKTAILDLTDSSINISLRGWYYLVKQFFYSLDAVEKEYITKYVLNKYRKDNGYQEGTYQKIKYVTIVEGSSVSCYEMEDNKVIQKVVRNVYDESRDLQDNIDLIYKSFDAVWKNNKELIIT